MAKKTSLTCAQCGKSYSSSKAYSKHLKAHELNNRRAGLAASPQPEPPRRNPFLEPDPEPETESGPARKLKS